MEEVVEKSCWNITLWAVAVVLGVMIVGSFVVSSGQNTKAGVEITPSVQAASAVSG